MSGIELEPLGDTDTGRIEVPVGRTVIGRGPFLQVCVHLYINNNTSLWWNLCKFNSRRKNKSVYGSVLRFISCFIELW